MLAEEMGEHLRPQALVFHLGFLEHRAVEPVVYELGAVRILGRGQQIERCSVNRFIRVVQRVPIGIRRAITATKRQPPQGEGTDLGLVVLRCCVVETEEVFVDRVFAAVVDDRPRSLVFHVGDDLRELGDRHPHALHQRLDGLTFDAARRHEEHFVQGAESSVDREVAEDEPRCCVRVWIPQPKISDRQRTKPRGKDLLEKAERLRLSLVFLDPGGDLVDLGQHRSETVGASVGEDLRSQQRVDHVGLLGSRAIEEREHRLRQPGRPARQSTVEVLVERGEILIAGLSEHGSRLARRQGVYELLEIVLLNEGHVRRPEPNSSARPLR